MRKITTYGHSITIKVDVVGKSHAVVATEALKLLHAKLDEYKIPLDTEWVMEFHKGLEIRNGESFIEPDSITIRAGWAEKE